MNPTNTSSWNVLKALHAKQTNIHLCDRFLHSPDRFDHFSIETDELLFDFSKHHINTEIFNVLLQFAKDQNLEEESTRFFGGSAINQTEDRPVLHTALRSAHTDSLIVNGENVIPKVHEVLAQMRVFSEHVISGKHTGFTGKTITDVVNIGIGGSDLGPKMVVKSLRKYHNHIKTHYVSNIDYAAMEEVLSTVNVESTLFVVVSKTFATIETLTNANTAKKAVVDHFGDEKSVAHHFVAVSTNIEKVTEFGISQHHIFAFWDWVGGRYSLWSSVGLSIALAIGFDRFEELLQGAQSADQHFKTASPDKNIPVIMALLDVWYNNFYDYRSLAVIPYSEDLSLFPKFLQQLDMESNGKYVDRQGERVQYNTSNVIWGEAGTDSQHSFFQFLHQGTDIVPVDFIGVRKTHMNEHDRILMSNLLAQSKALMEGTTQEEVDQTDVYNSHKNFEGNRPSSTFILKELTPHNVGFLTALYEHKVFVQGVLWNVFSFDQWGVQLGKRLALSISALESKDMDALDSSTKGLFTFMNKK